MASANFRPLYRRIDELTDTLLAQTKPEGYELPQRLQRKVARFETDFDLAWIYHDCGLDGIVVSFHEMRAALSRRVVTDSSLMPLYQQICNHQQAVDTMRSSAAQGVKIDLDYVRHLHNILCRDLPNIVPGRYRTDIMLHRVYLHEIHRPDRISYHLNKLVRELYTEQMESFHPIKRASVFHREFMHIFPFYNMTGKLGRLLLNHILLSNDYYPVVLHVKERQRYYQALRDSLGDLRILMVESMENTLQHACEAVG
jgi:hypothetical protein